jgi:hypothetical protein
MANEGQPNRLTTIAQAIGPDSKGLPPLDEWNPPDCGDIDMRIGTDGTWYYQNSPIGRPALVRLFSSILKREGDDYYLVTPVEKCRIVVDDAPFVAIDVMGEPGEGGRLLRFRTNVGDEIVCGREHPLRFEPEAIGGGLKPYLHVRRNLWAKVSRPVYYELTDMGEERDIDGVCWFGIGSVGEFFPMVPASELADSAE